MRPLQLSITAFGPFATHEQIDFSELGENPLFLINGPTGAGKTTLLDALCFALYGQTTGAEREGKQMRCDFAADDLLTEVAFTFALKGKHYRIHRVPEQSKPRKRGTGEGEVVQKPTASLHEITGGGDALLANKVTDATKAIEELTGLQIDQFRQVMVLPQGKFRKLLTADSGDREKIFSQLFQTHIYKRIEDKLKAKAKEVRVAVLKLRDNQNGVLESVNMETPEDLQRAIAIKSKETTAAQHEHQTAQTQLLALTKKQQDLQQLEQQFLQLEQQQEKQRDLAAQADTIKQLHQQISDAESAERMQALYQQQQRSEQESQAAYKHQQQAQKDFAQQQQALTQIEEVVKTLPSLQQQLAAAQKAFNELQAYQQRSQQLESARTDLATKQQGLAKHQEHVNAQERQCVSLTTQRAALEQSKHQLAQQQANEAELKTGLAQLQTQWKSVQERDALAQNIEKKRLKLTTIAKKGKALKAELDAAETAQKQLDLLWHQGQAAILASELQQDQACPVCGSLEHPNPAYHEQQNVPTEQQRQDAQHQVERLRPEYIQARENYSSLHKEIEKDQARYDELVREVAISAAELQQQIRQTETALKTWEKQQAEKQELEQQLIQLLPKQEQLNSALEQSKQQFAELQAAVEASKALVTQAEQELPEAYREQGVLANALQKNEQTQQQRQQQIEQIHNQQIVINKQFEAAKTSLESANKEADKRLELARQDTAKWQQQLADSVFRNEEQFTAALLDQEQLQHLKQQVKKHDEQYQHIQGAIDQQQALLKDKQRPDLLEIEQELLQQSQLAQDKEQRWQAAHALQQNLQNAQDSIQTIAKKQQAQEESYQVIGTLADVATGQTGNKISLQRFVLGVLLDDVLIAASERLTRMSKGRYQLLRKEERAKGNKASGLELEVADGYTGKTRSVATLSGGESFIASLSLALGLSEVVQAYAGGVQLDTLFVDEGFGSLDSDSLDTAIRTLIDLRESGRMVGIISHVSELKEQISQRLDIISDRNGSHIKIVT